MGLWTRRLPRPPLGVTVTGTSGSRAADPIERYWDNAHEHGGIRTWMAEPRFRAYINFMVTGSVHEWPLEWFKRELAPAPFGTGLSIGCGEGALERDLRRKDICREVVGVDIARGALQLAQQRAAQEGLTGIIYRRADFNRLLLPPASFDVVFFHQALHHVEQLEKCVGVVRSGLSARGLIYLDEYVGPSRADWNRSLLARADAVLDSIPSAARSCARLALPIQHDDPSEAVRSAEILTVVRRHFEIVEQRDYGGNLIALLHPVIRWDRLAEPARARLQLRLIREEQLLLACGAPSFHTVLVAKPRR